VSAVARALGIFQTWQRATRDEDLDRGLCQPEAGVSACQGCRSRSYDGSAWADPTLDLRVFSREGTPGPVCATAAVRFGRRQNTDYPPHVVMVRVVSVRLWCLVGRARKTGMGGG